MMVVNVQLNESKSHFLYITYLHVDGDFNAYTAELQIITQSLLGG